MANLTDISVLNKKIEQLGLELETLKRNKDILKEKKFLSVKEVALLLDLTERTIYNKTSRGELLKVNMNSKKSYYLREDIEKYIEDNCPPKSDYRSLIF